MPVEIRELNIKGSVSSSSFGTERKFQQLNSPLLNTQFVSQLKKDIIEECEQRILEIIERKNRR